MKGIPKLQRHLGKHSSEVNPQKTYIIITEERSGTHLLQGLLGPHIKRIDISDFLAGKTFDTDVYCRIHTHHLIKIPEVKSRIIRLYSECPDTKFIFLSRRDRLKQSLSVAKSTVIKDPDTRAKRRHPLTENTETPEDFSRVDDALIKRGILEKVLLYAFTETFFRELKCEPLRLFYEDDLENSDQWKTTVTRVLEFMGYRDIELRPDYEDVVGMKKASGKITAKKYKEFLDSNLDKELIIA